MSLFMIAWRSLRQRWLASSLTAFSMALGVALIVAVITIHGITTQQFSGNDTLGYNMIVGAKGGALQLTMNSVYYLSDPIENIDYRYYLEFLPAEQRAAELQNSYAYHAHDALRETLALSHTLLPAAAPLAGAQATAGTEPVTDSLRQAALGLHRTGRFSDYTQFAIPLCMGDYYGQFRVIGTTPAMFETLPQAAEREVTFAAGRNLETWNKEHGYFEAVIGSAVAAEKKLGVGDQVFPTHGDPEGHAHENGFMIVGVLAPTGSPQDRGVFVNMEGFYLMGGHAKPLPEADEEEGGAATDAGAALVGAAPAEAAPPLKREQRELQPLPLEQRELTAFLLRTLNPFVAQGLQNLVNEGDKAQAVQPIAEIFNLFDMFVTPLKQIMLLLTLLIVIVSGISILVSIYNSMSERRHEIAVMRALGARRGTVMWIILLESIMLALGGGVCGWVLGHLLNGLASPLVEARTGVAIGFFQLAPPVTLTEFLGIAVASDWEIYPELLLIPMLMLLAIAVGLLPSLSAYRTDVADSLGK